MNAIAGAITAAKAAYQAGFTGNALLMAVAIAGAESGFNHKAIGDVDLAGDKWGPSIGLWQIRSLNPGYLHMDPVRDKEKLFDPYENARAAFKISKGGTYWIPWVAFLNNRYQGHEQVALEAIEAMSEKKMPILLIGILIIIGLYFIFK